METSSPGFFARVAERALGWVALGLVVAAGIGLWQIGPDARGAIWATIWRTTVWLIIAAGLPWSARFFIRRLTTAGTNWAGIGLVTGYTVLDAVAGVLLLAGWPEGFWSWFAAVATLGVAGTYNYLVAEYLAEQFGG